MNGKPSFMTTLTHGLIGILLIVVLGAALWTWGSLKFVYAAGERAGYLQKFSKKGWLCKTWEGEMALVTLPGTSPEIFYFTVRDEAVAAKVNTLIGQRISIHYEQHKGIPTRCYGDTEYFVTGVQPVGQQLP